MAPETGRQVAGRAIRLRRGELGMTQGALASKAGVDPKTISNVETGKNWPHTESQSRIERTLGWDSGTLERIAERPADYSASGLGDLIPRALSREEATAQARLSMARSMSATADMDVREALAETDRLRRLIATLDDKEDAEIRERLHKAQEVAADAARRANDAAGEVRVSAQHLSDLVSKPLPVSPETPADLTYVVPVSVHSSVAEAIADGTGPLGRVAAVQQALSEMNEAVAELDDDGERLVTGYVAAIYWLKEARGAGADPKLVRSTSRVLGLILATAIDAMKTGDSDAS